MFSYPQQRKNGTVLILGAGASFGSSIDIRPPIMNNFIREGLQRVNKDYKDYYEILWRFLGKLGYPLESLISGSPNLEEVYSILHVVSSGLWHRHEKEFVQAIGEEFWKIPPVCFLESFIIEITDKPSTLALEKTCIYHDVIIDELSTGDTVISFNYDLIVDASVKKMKNWSEYNGYGFIPFNQVHMDGKTEFLTSKSDISLLKPHGSLNWHLETLHNFDMNGQMIISKEESQSLREKLLGGKNQQSELFIDLLSEIKGVTYHELAVDVAKYNDELIKKIPKEEKWKFQGVFRPKYGPLIVPPSLYKFGNPNTPKELTFIWSSIYNALILANKVICIGYSFPPNDMEFNTLFRLAIRNNKQKRLKILLVNPSSEIIDKVQALAPDKKVFHVANTLADYVKMGK